MQKGRIHIGTSGWHYGHWKGPFYPADLPAERMLAFYQERFATVEVNNSFYQLPAAQTLEEWRQAAPEGFLFAVKASRYLTHLKKLKDPEQPLATFLGRMETLGEKLGPVLFQLPPRWRRNVERLRAFLGALPEGRSYAFEFRDPSWFHPEVYAALAERGCACCIFERAGLLSPQELTAGFAYLRLHGPGGAYQGEYGRQGLAGWAGAISAWSRGGRDVYCYFDNDQAGFAARDALRLRQMLGEAG